MPAAGAGEPAVVHLARVLWRRRSLIVVGSVCPAVLVALALLLGPRKYTATFVYERPLTESQYNVLLRRFHSSENLDKIRSRLKENELTHYAQRLARAQTEASLAKLIRFAVSPAYPRRLQTTDPATSEKISAFQAQLLSIEITGRSRQNMPDIAAVITGNVENVLPVYQVRNDLKESIQRYRTRAAEIEDNRFTLSLDIQKETSRLEKLEGLGGSAPDSPGQNVVLQFTDVQNSQEVLPLPYQIRAVQAKIIELQETQANNEEKYKYFTQVLDTESKLLAKIEEGILTHYTVQQYLGFLGEQLLACQDEALSDFLKSYIRKTENLILTNTRAGENPVVYPVSRHIVKRSGLTLVVLLMITTFLAVSLEARGHARGRPGPPRPPA